MRALRSILAFALCASLARAEEPRQNAAPAKGQEAATGAVMEESAAEDPGMPVEIPLDSIYAFKMPSTKDVRELEPNYLAQGLSDPEVLNESVVEQIRRSLKTEQRPRKQPGKGFAVVGNPLRKARDVLTGKKAATAMFPSDSDLWLVVFSCTSGLYMHLDGVWVNHHRDEVTIKYHFARHSTLEMTEHFALIPVGILPPGKYEVKLVQNPVVAGDRLATNEPVEQARIQHIICDSFGFYVHEGAEGAFHGLQ